MKYYIVMFKLPSVVVPIVRTLIKLGYLATSSLMNSKIYFCFKFLIKMSNLEWLN